MKTISTIKKIKLLIIASCFLTLSFETYSMPDLGGGGGGCDPANPAGTTNLCADPCSPCGAACGFATNPTVDQVIDNCPSWEYNPALAGCFQTTNCQTFTAAATTVNIGLIINSTCTDGNVVYFNWSLYTNCSKAATQTGSLATTLTMTGLTIGVTYSYCYTLQVPDGCSHTLHYPYFVGATPLSNEASTLSAKFSENSNQLKWTVPNNDAFASFEIEYKNEDAEWTTIHKVTASERSVMYTYSHNNFSAGQNYYRIKQLSKSGGYTHSNITTLSNKSIVKRIAKTYNLQGQEVASDAKGFVIVVFEDGTVEKQYRNIAE